MVQTYQWISIIGYICAGIFFAAAVFLFFYLNIPQVFGYLTKRTERKAVEKIRAENEQKAEMPDQEHSEQKVKEAAAVEETSRLIDANATTLLQNDTNGQTVDLKSVEKERETSQDLTAAHIVVEEELILIHTEEMIE